MDGLRAVFPRKLVRNAFCWNLNMVFKFIFHLWKVITSFFTYILAVNLIAYDCHPESDVVVGEPVCGTHRRTHGLTHIRTDESSRKLEMRFLSLDGLDEVALWPQSMPGVLDSILHYHFSLITPSDG